RATTCEHAPALGREPTPPTSLPPSLRAMSAHPLTRFVYETFGQQFGDLILAGYGAEPGGGQKKLSLTEADEGTETHWVIEVVASRHPSGDEPLVLAALLKLLLSRRVISQPL